MTIEEIETAVKMVQVKSQMEYVNQVAKIVSIIGPKDNATKALLQGIAVLSDKLEKLLVV